MQNVISDMQVFVAVCRSRNFRRAAVALEIPASTLSRRVNALEQNLGLQLLNRSSRKFELTEDGETYLKQIAPLVEQLVLAHDEIRISKSNPSGRLRISMTHGLAMAIGMDWIAEFSRLYPDIHYEIHTEPSKADVLADRFDVAIRREPPTETQLIVRRAGRFTFSLYASPAYIAQHGEPRTPHELSQHECIRIASMPTQWTLTHNDNTVGIDISGRFLCDATVLARPLALAGLGIARLMSSITAAEEDAGRLVRVLPEWTSEAMPLYIITPTRLLPHRTRLFIDFLAEKMRLR